MTNEEILKKAIEIENQLDKINKNIYWIGLCIMGSGFLIVTAINSITK